jgi:mannose-6-phosphate isomerase-like protein (cupin superfamily)
MEHPVGETFPRGLVISAAAVDDQRLLGKEGAMTFAPGLIALNPGEGDRLEAFGNVHVNRVVGSDTGGGWTLVEQHVTGANPPLHQHEHEDEAFYVLQGRVRVLVGDAAIDGEAGSFVFAPRGVPHTFARQPGDDLKMLLMIAPAALERFFDEVSRLSDSEQQDPSMLSTLAARYGVQVLGPPPE